MDSQRKDPDSTHEAATLPPVPASVDSLALAQEVDALCDRYEEALRNGEKPDLDGWLPAGGPARKAALVELVRLDLEHRRRAGEAATVEEYLSRYPELADHAATLAAPDEAATLPPAADPYATRYSDPTLAHAPDPYATRYGSAEAKGDAAKPSAPAVPGYEILGELGRGGMGVVYKTRHIQLNRVVALKMILAGGHAGPDDLQRFRTEAEAVARLQHPNIVQIFEVGEHGGLPFFSLEFCGGGALDRKLGGAPLPPKEAAALVETLARAMHAAHEKGVIHRDLKPANVLLAEDGSPKITDFGLAKKLDAAGQTQSGAIMGTPSYMAPEQAGGKSSAIGPAADVYALGAILYECLTGRPPFKAATVMDTILQVAADEPVAPRQLQSKTPRDLETICLKCLRKESPKRYASAAALAEDLGRFQRGEPITARPVGRTERAWRWCRRNPALAAVLVVFAVGATVSSILAVLAGRRADEAVKAQGLADHEKATAIAAKDDLQKSNDRLLTTTARSLLRPLAQQGQPNQPPPPSDPEIEALWELASSPDNNLHVCFVKEALRGPAPTRQLKDRAAFALQAAVGLDAARRAEVEHLLGDRLVAKETPPDQQRDVALTLAQLGVRDPAIAANAARVLTQAMTKTTDWNLLDALPQGFSALAARMEPKEAGKAAALITQAMAKRTHLLQLPALAQRLSAVAARMESNEAAAACAQAAALITQAIATTHAGGFRLAQGLSAVAARMEPNEAAALLTQTMAKTSDPAELQQLAQGLSAVAARMEPKDAAAACAQAAALLTQAMAKSPDLTQLQQLAQGLSVVAVRMEPKDASEAAALVTETMAKTTGQLQLQQLAQALSAVAVRMEPNEAAPLLTQTMGKTSDPIQLRQLAQGLSAVAARMEPNEAAVLITQAMARSTDTNPLPPLAEGLSAVAARMEPKAAAALLTQAMAKSMNTFQLQPLAQGLSVVAARMESKEAGEAAALLTETMANTTNQFQLRQLAQGLSVVAARMEPKEAAALLIHEMAKATYPGQLQQLAQGLSVVAAQMEPKEAAAACAQAAALITQAMVKQWDAFPLQQLAQSLSAVAAWMETKEAAAACAQAAALLTKAMDRTTDPMPLEPFAQGLSAVAARMEPKEGAAACAQAAALITQAMAKTTYAGSLQQLAQDLSAVLSQVGPAEEAQRSAPAIAAAVGIAATGSSPLTACPLLPFALELLPAGLPTPQLVELLKHPLCVGEARRAVLDVLGWRYGRHFDDQWDFVEFAEQQKLGLDFTSPPQPPPGQ